MLDSLLKFTSFKIVNSRVSTIYVLCVGAKFRWWLISRLLARAVYPSEIII